MKIANSRATGAPTVAALRAASIRTGRRIPATFSNAIFAISKRTRSSASTSIWSRMPVGCRGFPSSSVRLPFRKSLKRLRKQGVTSINNPLLKSDKRLLKWHRRLLKWRRWLLKCCKRPPNFNTFPRERHIWRPKRLLNYRFWHRFRSTRISPTSAPHCPNSIGWDSETRIFTKGPFVLSKFNRPSVDFDLWFMNLAAKMNNF
ncbi:unnamed protein product [Nesidiocoris tenuis]|uniref:Uncharacterized protein n=1 Tax=Nesidiocoris tenuis TaxID=355587 RepID=A0A6H5G7J4_9HEMI|nr:unnamed protein product [Nesidiocoris tenuis]